MNKLDLHKYQNDILKKNMASFCNFAALAEACGLRSLFNMFLCFLLGSPTPCALKVADKIAEQFDNAVLLMVRKTEVKLFYRLSLTCWFNLDIVFYCW